MLKFVFTALITFIVTMLICLPFMSFPDEKIDSKPVKQYYEGKVVKTDCDNEFVNTKSYIKVDENKFNLDYNLCESVSEDSYVKVQYDDDLKVHEISYIKNIK